MMGHRDRVDYAYINFAMETYHSDIGSRLSNLYVPTSPSYDQGKHLPADFRFLTIDPRQDNIRKQTVELPLTKTPARNKLKFSFARKSTPKTAKLAEGSTSCSTTSSSGNFSFSKDSIPELSQHGKLTLKQRLTRALFKKKHVCCRCQRKSSGCILNKTFTGIEKHYTCSRCREACNAVKNVFDKQSNLNSMGHSHSSKMGYVQNKLQKSQTGEGHYKDSGYETVTSCSTVASGRSTFTSVNCGLRQRKDIPAFKSAGNDISALDLTGNYNLSHCGESSGPSQPNTHNSSMNLNPPISRVNMVCNKTTTAHNCHDTNRQEPGLPVPNLRQIPQRKINMYDGYLPDFYQNISGHDKKLKLLTDTKNSSDKDFHSSEMVKLGKSKAISTPGQQCCHICEALCKVFFRLPWEGGWICEDCLDHLH